MKTEILQEGWVQFRRTYFKEGYVDRWSGDQADNPNDLEKRKLNLNSFIVYYRCNGGEWIVDRGINREYQILDENTIQTFTADEWFFICAKEPQQNE